MSKKTLLVLVVIAILGFISIAYADSVSIDTSIGVFNSGKRSLSESKLLRFGVEEYVWYNFKEKVNTGFWLDNAGDGRTGSAFISYQLGFNVHNSVFEMSLYTGPALISSSDIYLGGHFQFNDTAYFGICDVEGNSIGVSYNHFSSAGLEVPNIGRDFVGAEIKFPF